MSPAASLALGAVVGLAVLLWIHRPRAMACRRARAAAVERALAAIPGNHVLLTGPPRREASRALAAIQDRLRARSADDRVVLPAALDLRDVADGRLFAALGEALLEALGAHLGVSPTGPAPSRREYDFHHLVRDLERLTTALARRHGRTAAIAVLLDHAELLDRHGTRTAQRLRSLLMKGFAEHLVCVAAADRISREWSCHTSPWFNVFEEIQVR